MKQKIDLPSLANDAAYTAANDKLNSLKADLNEAERKKDEVLSALNTKRPQSDPINDAALKMLGALPSTELKLLQENFSDLNVRIHVIRAAIAIQKNIVDGLVAAASFKAMDAVRPLHRELVQTIVEQIKALDETLSAEHHLRETLFQRGFYVGSIRPMGLVGLGLLNNPDSRSSAYLLEAHREGFVTLNELPDNLQKMLPPETKAQPKSGGLFAGIANDWIGG